MNSERKIAVLRAGIIPGDAAKQLARWNGCEEDLEHIDVEPDPKQALSDIRDAIESRETVELRSTDLDAIHFYEKNQKAGRLYYSIPHGTARRTTFVNVKYAKTPIGNFMIPWSSENIFDLMLDEGTYLKPDGEPRVYFLHVSELYYDEQKAFMVCVPSDDSGDKEEGDLS